MPNSTEIPGNEGFGNGISLIIFGTRMKFMDGWMNMRKWSSQKRCKGWGTRKNLFFLSFCKSFLNFFKNLKSLKILKLLKKIHTLPKKRRIATKIRASI